jgi:sulfite exporter TauE/SafE
MDISIATPLAALVAGLATSVHCTVMCGPLACALRVRPAEYHLGRFGSYTIAGGIAGALGSVVVRFFQGNASHFFPWILAAVLLLLGLGLEKRLPQPRALSGLLLRVRLNRSLGWLTPLLPCGPLWLMLATSAVAGSWHHGALLMAAFVLSTIPMPWLLQLQAANLQRRFSPFVLRWTQQSVALVSAALLVWRAMLPATASCH